MGRADAVFSFWPDADVPWRPIAVVRAVGYLERMTSNGKLLKRVDSADGRRYVELRERGDLFVFEEFSEASDGEYTFIAPSHCSGLYANAAEAEQDMIAQLPWLRDAKVR